MKYGRNGRVIIEKSDQCYTCLLCESSVVCPLMEALHDGAVLIAAQSLQVQNCDLYQEIPQKENPLKLTRKEPT